MKGEPPAGSNGSRMRSRSPLFQAQHPLHSGTKEADKSTNCAPSVTPVSRDTLPPLYMRRTRLEFSSLEILHVLFKINVSERLDQASGLDLEIHILAMSWISFVHPLSTAMVNTTSHSFKRCFACGTSALEQMSQRLKPRLHDESCSSVLPPECSSPP